MSEGLCDLVFSLSLEDILNDELFKNQVEKITDKFLSAKHYLGSFTFPLLEETRAELTSSLEGIQRAPFSEVVSIDESKPIGSLNYEINVNYWRNKYNERGKYPYRTLPGDILIISGSRPENCSDLRRVGWKWAFAHVTEISKDEKGSEISSSYFKVKVSRDIEVKEGISKSLFVVFLRNITTNKRIWKALHMCKNLDIINQVLSPESEVEEDSRQPCASGMIENIGTNLLSNLNESQIETILAPLTKLPGLRHAILVGDECQLPAMGCSNLSADAGFGRSLFERLSLLGRPKHLLNMQYRMHPSISFFPNSNFYSNRISDAPLVKSTNYEKNYLPGKMFGPYSFINVVGGKEEADDDFQYS